MINAFRYSQSLATAGFFLLWIGSGLSLKAQQSSKRIDSLERLAASRMEDTLKVKAQLQLAHELLVSGNYDASMHVALAARSLSFRLGYATGVACSWLATGRSHLKKNQYDSAMTHLHKALSVFEVINDRARQGTVNMAIGQVYDYQARYDDALKKYDLALELLQNSGDTIQMIQIWNFKGNSYFNRGSYEIALEYYLKAYGVSLETRKTTPFRAPLNNIGVVYAQMGQYEEALKYLLRYKDSIEQQHENKKNDLAGVLLNIGECYNKLGQPKQALVYLNKAIPCQKELSDRRGLSLSYSNLADSYRLLAQPANAEFYYTQSVRLARDIKNKEVLLNPLIGMGHLYIRQGKESEAASVVQEALSTSAQIKSKLWEVKSLLLASQLDSMRGRDRESLDWFKRYYRLHDSLFSEQRSRQVIQMRELYESEKREKEIKLLSEAKKFEELKRAGEHTLFMICVSFLTLAVLTIGYWAISKTRDSKILKQQKDEVANVNRELKVLLDRIESQNKALANKNEILEDLHQEKDGLIGIVAHDLRSPLNRIAGLSNLVELCGDLTSEQRDMLHGIKKVCADGNNLIQDLLDINHYETSKKLDLSEIELTQFTAELLDRYVPFVRDKHLTLHYDYDMTKRVALLTDQECLVRVLDNLLTNAIKFSPPGKHIFVTLEMQQTDRVTLSIRDEGPGFKDEDLPHLFKKFKKLSARPTAGESSTGLGLSIVKSLVDRLGGMIQIKPLSEGAEVLLTFEATVFEHAAANMV